MEITFFKEAATSSSPVIGWLSALFTVVAGSATVAIAILTRQVVRENRMLRRAGSLPRVVAYINTNQQVGFMADFVVANVGQGPAFNINMSVIADQSNFTQHRVKLKIMNQKTILRILPQGEKFTTTFGSWYKIAKKDQFLQPFHVKVEYISLTGEKIEDEYYINVKDFESFSMPRTPDAKTIADSLKKISEDFRRFAFSSRLKVETATQQEVQENLNKQLEAYEEEDKREAANKD